MVRGNDACLGVAYGPVRVHSGATLTLAEAGTAANNRSIRIAGSGSGAAFPAVRFTGSAIWNKTSNVRWILEDDAAMYASMTGEDGSFLRGAIEMNGHTLTLKGVTDSHFRFGRTFQWNGSAYGKINLFAGVKLPVAALEVDGDKQKMGLYGSSSSAAEYVRDDLFMGAGVLRVGEPIGLMIIIR